MFILGFQQYTGFKLYCGAIIIQCPCTQSHSQALRRKPTRSQPIRGGVGLGTGGLRPSAVQTGQYNDKETQEKGFVLISVVRAMNFTSKITA